MLTKAVYDPSGPSTVTTTYTYNDANEQTNMDDGTTSIDMTYDEWGRLVEKDDGTYTATYAYRYGGKLYSVTSNFPGEGNVTYETGGDGKRRSRIAGASETWYNYTVGFDVVSTEDDADGSTGALTMTNVVLAPTAQVSATLGDLTGTTPSTGTARYYATDHLGSTRSAWNVSKAAVGSYEFTPYGGAYSHTGAALDSLAGAYTGKPWDNSAGFFHFPYRQYSPSMARWTSRDPLGMVDGPNVYGYVAGNPIGNVDPLGLLSLSDTICAFICGGIFALACRVGGWPGFVVGGVTSVICAYFCEEYAPGRPGGGGPGGGGPGGGGPPPPPPNPCPEGYKLVRTAQGCFCEAKSVFVEGPYRIPVQCPGLGGGGGHTGEW